MFEIIYLEFMELRLRDELCGVSQGARLNRLYESWEEDPNVGFVMMKVFM